MGYVWYVGSVATRDREEDMLVVLPVGYVGSVVIR